MKYLTNLDLQQNQLIKAVVQNVAGLDGVLGVDGQIIYDTVSQLLYVYKDETGWVAVGGVLSVNGQTGAVSLSLEDLDNTTISSIVSGEILKWNGTAWVNNTLEEAGIEASDITIIKEADIGNGLMVTDHTLTLGTPSTLNSSSTNTVTESSHTHAITTYDVSATGPVEVSTGGKVLGNAITISMAAATASVNGYMSSTYAAKLDGIEAGAEVNVNADWDATSGDAEILNKPTTVAGYGITDVYTDLEVDGITSALEFRIEDLELIDHIQNTDLGTSSDTFYIGTSGPKIKNASGEIQLRNNADSAYADLRVKDLYVEGTQTIINSNTVNIGDNIITLNADIEDNAANSDGGIAIKRLKSDDITENNAELIYSESNGRWLQKFGDVQATLVTATVAAKLSATIGDATHSSFVITHNLNTRDLVVNIRETGGSYELVQTDVRFESLDTIIVSFAAIPAVDAYTVTIIG